MSASRAVLPFALLCLTACATKPPYQINLPKTISQPFTNPL